jgi:hypothetical protein
MVGTGIASADSFPAEAFEGAYAKAIGSPLGTVKVVGVAVVASTRASGNLRRSLLQIQTGGGGSDNVLSVEVAITTQDKSVADRVETQIESDQGYAALYREIGETNVFPDATNVVAEGSYLASVVETVVYACSIHSTCGSCISDSFDFMGGEVSCAWCGASDLCVHVDSPLVGCSGGSLQSFSADANVCMQMEESTFDVMLVIYAAAGGGGLLLMAVLVVKRNAIKGVFRETRSSGRNVSVTPPRTSVTQQPQPMSFDDLCDNLEMTAAASAPHRHASGPSVLPPISNASSSSSSSNRISLSPDKAEGQLAGDKSPVGQVIENKYGFAVI